MSTLKLFVNAGYGKTLERKVDKDKNILCRATEDQIKYFGNPNFKDFYPLSKDILIVKMRQEEVVYDRPIQIGTSILDLSKVIMLSFYYTQLKSLFKDIRPLYSDTDSIIFSTIGERKLQLEKMLPFLDTSNFPKDHPLYSNDKERELFFMKSETSINKIELFAGIKSKCYYIRTENKDNYFKLKGVYNSIPENLIGEAGYLDTLVNNSNLFVKFNKISSKRHSLFKTSIIRKALSSYDDKNFIKNCGIHLECYGPDNNSKCLICDY